MARPQYPSDAARVKMRPHVRVHLTTRTHRRTAEVFASPELRGMLVGLWQLAAEAYAGKTGNVVHLDRTAVMWCTGRTQYAHAERALRALCARMEYAVSAHGALVAVHVRNFEQKQGYGSAARGATPQAPPPPKTEDRRPKKEEELTPSESAAAEPAAAVVDPLERPLRLLSREPGSAESKRAWLAQELPLIEAEAAQIEPNGKTASQHFRATLIRYWRQYRSPQRRLDDRAERTRAAAVGALFNKGIFE